MEYRRMLAIVLAMGMLPLAMPVLAEEAPAESIRERLLKEIVTPLLGEKGLDDVDRVDNITVYPDGRLIVTIDDEEIERVWR